VIRRLSVSLLAIIAIMSGATIVSQAQPQALLTRHTREVTLNGQAPLVGHLPATQSMRLVLVLPQRNQKQLDNFLKELYDPNSATYRKFLTVEEFTARFGPSQEDYDSVIRFAEANGFTVVGTSRNRMNLDVTGSVVSIEKAFNLTMGIYQHPSENRTFFSPDREPTADLAVQLWHITGLDNYSIPKPGLVRRDASVPSAKANATTGSGPSDSFLGSDMRAAYYVDGSSAATLTGSGQSLGLFEFIGTDLADLTTYYKNAGQTNSVPITLKSVDTQSTSCVFADGCDDTEQTLDMTQALGMAPGLSSLVMYIGTGALSGQTLDDSGILNAMATASPLNAQLSCSWQWSPSDSSTDNIYFKEFAAQGQNLFVDAGDDGTWTSSGFYWPTDSVYVTGVGGTDLETTGAGGAWSSETGWIDTGGGIGPDDFAIPSWQVTAAAGCAECSQTHRNGPDVAANANFTFYVCADQEACTANLYGGTSFATPMWAGYLALANEQYLSNGATSTLGFINPALYTIGLGSNYNTDFHDITSGGNTEGTTVGYDLSTGWGSPNGSALIDALAPSSGPNFTISASPAAVSVVQGKSGTSTITTAVSGGFDSAVALSATGQPTGVTATFSPTSIAAPGSGTSTLTLAVASTTAAGKYTITVTGTGGGQKHTTTVTLTVTAAASFSITASPNAITVARGSSGTSIITTSIGAGFDSAITLSASGQGAAQTVTFSPDPINAPGSGTSTMTVIVGINAGIGVHTILITGTGGGITRTTTVALTVTASAAPNFTISASPATITVARGSSGTVTITTASEGSFDSAITLSAPFKCSPNPIAAPGSGASTMTIAVGGSAALGAHTLAITGSGGGIQHTTTVILTVVE
jgi:subtilase family serine protease